MKGTTNMSASQRTQGQFKAPREQRKMNPSGDQLSIGNTIPCYQEDDFNSHKENERKNSHSDLVGLRPPGTWQYKLPILGKVKSLQRTWPTANLPSLKSENSPNIPIGTTWASVCGQSVQPSLPENVIYSIQETKSRCLEDDFNSHKENERKNSHSDLVGLRPPVCGQSVQPSSPENVIYSIQETQGRCLEDQFISLREKNSHSHLICPRPVSDEDRFFYILSTIPKAKIEPKADIRYHVFGEVLDYPDFQSLEGDGWLTITVMNAFLLILKEEQNIYVLPSHMAVLWSNDQYKSFLLKKIHLSVFEWIFMAINVNNCHWVLLAANVPSKKVSILDSLKNDNQNLIEQWKMYMQIRGNLVRELTGEWKTGDLESSDQKDDSSCGPFTLMNALAIVNSIPTKSLSQGHALHMRKCIKDKLLSVAKTCNEVGCSKPEQGKLWNQYNKCLSWSHHICANIAEKPIGDNVCPVCEAEYK